MNYFYDERTSSHIVNYMAWKSSNLESNFSIPKTERKSYRPMQTFVPSTLLAGINSTLHIFLRVNFQWSTISTIWKYWKHSFTRYNWKKYNDTILILLYERNSLRKRKDHLRNVLLLIRYFIPVTLPKSNFTLSIGFFNCFCDYWLTPMEIEFRM